MKESRYYLNGKFVKKSEAKVSVYDMGFLRSYGVVDFLITYHGKPFRLNDHLKRFYNSAKLIGLKIPYKKEKTKRLIFQTLAKNKFKESSIWLIATGGVGPTSMIPAKKSTLAILVNPYKPYPKICYQKGVKIITFKAKRIIPQAKSMVYTQAIQALTQAYKKRAIEALYLVNGKVTECMTSNFFIFKNNKLLTAKDKDVLAGITRQVVFKITQGVFPLKQADLSLKQVLKADEAFLAASNKEIMPVVKIDNYILGKGKVGPNTRKLMKLFRKAAASF
jgi:branched-chain amino acid aminotransferase